jgi:hypothetical protein
LKWEKEDHVKIGKGKVNMEGVGEVAMDVWEGGEGRKKWKGRSEMWRMPSTSVNSRDLGTICDQATLEW